MTIAHARLSASGSHRWLACPGSVKAEQGYKDSSSPHALEGTAAHELAELVLTRGGNAFEWEGITLPETNSHTVTHEMASNVQQYVDYVKGLGGHQMYEQRVDFSEWVPEGFGTSDAIVINGDTLHAIDLKFGKGIRVDAEENTQGLLYLLGAFSEYDMLYGFRRMVITIVQPRLDHISEWEIDRADLLRWADWIKEKAAEAVQDYAPRHPGESQCRWCKAKADCPTLEAHAHDIIAADFDSMDDLEEPDGAGPERIATILAAKPLIVSWLDAIEQVGRERIESGQTLPGFKLVAGRSIRRWADDGEAEQRLVELLGDKSHERKLLSVAKAEKALGKKRAAELADLIIKPEGKPAMAPEHDSRPALGATCDDFDSF